MVDVVEGYLRWRESLVYIDDSQPILLVQAVDCDCGIFILSVAHSSFVYRNLLVQFGDDTWLLEVGKLELSFIDIEQKGHCIDVETWAKYQLRLGRFRELDFLWLRMCKRIYDCHFLQGSENSDFKLIKDLKIVQTLMLWVEGQFKSNCLGHWLKCKLPNHPWHHSIEDPMLQVVRLYGPDAVLALLSSWFPYW